MVTLKSIKCNHCNYMNYKSIKQIENDSDIEGLIAVYGVKCHSCGYTTLAFDGTPEAIAELEFIARQADMFS